MIPSDLSCRVKSFDELVGLLNSSSLLTTLTTREVNTLVSVLMSSPGLLAVLPGSAVVNALSALCSKPDVFDKLPRPILYSTLAVFSDKSKSSSDCVPASLWAQLADRLFSLSPGVLYDMPTPTLVNVFGPACSPDVLSGLSSKQLANFVTLLSLSPALVEGLPIPGFVCLVDHLGAKADVLSELPPTTLFDFLRCLFDVISRSSKYLLNESNVPAIVKLLVALMTPDVLGVLPVNAFQSLLTMIWSSPSLLVALPVSNVVSLLTTVVSSPNVLVAVDASHLNGLLDAIAFDGNMSKSVPTKLIVELLNSLAVYLPKFVSSMSKPTISKLLGVEIN